MPACVIADVKVKDPEQYRQYPGLYREARARRNGATEYFNMVVVEGA
jgi:hypothetical protein